MQPPHEKSFILLHARHNFQFALAAPVLAKLALQVAEANAGVVFPAEHPTLVPVAMGVGGSFYCGGAASLAHMQSSLARGTPRIVEELNWAYEVFFPSVLLFVEHVVT